MKSWGYMFMVLMFAAGLVAYVVVLLLLLF